MRVLLYDRSQGSLSFLWGVGSFFLGRFKHVVAASTVAEARTELEKIDGICEHFQFWGHGLPGKIFINSQSVEPEMLNDVLDFRSTSVGWLRGCASFATKAGIDFAERWTNVLGCGVVGHTRLVSTPSAMYQSGGKWLVPGRHAFWSPTDGVGPDGEIMGSTRSAPDTCSVFTMNPPLEWRR